MIMDYELALQQEVPPLSCYNCFTIDEGSAQAETVCGTVSGRRSRRPQRP
jgi:hypothetical protein